MKHPSIREQVERCIEELRRGELTEEGLQGVLDSIDRRRERRGRKRRQDLLYLHTRSTSIDYPVLGMRILENGVLWDGPRDPDEWPYKTVVEAVNDGWRSRRCNDAMMSLGRSSNGRNSRRNSTSVSPNALSATAGLSSIRRACSEFGSTHQARRASSSVSPGA